MAINSEQALAMVEAVNGPAEAHHRAEPFRPDSQYQEAVKMPANRAIYFAALPSGAEPTWGIFLNAERQGGGPSSTSALALDLTLAHQLQPKSVMVTFRSWRIQKCSPWGPGI